MGLSASIASQEALGPTVQDTWFPYLITVNINHLLHPGPPERRSTPVLGRAVHAGPTYREKVWESPTYLGFTREGCLSDFPSFLNWTPRTFFVKCVCDAMVTNKQQIESVAEFLTSFPL